MNILVESSPLDAEHCSDSSCLSQRVRRGENAAYVGEILSNARVMQSAGALIRHFVRFNSF